ncbi:MAG TPA: DUF423 domain-containing protein [Chloroflexi bacterium]|jgi:uncharacterized membrane protein YgdD (TMEM256/DUF423 family)|nr:DUF423 domain-containing protein [Chloroflexota bacterium]
MDRIFTIIASVVMFVGVAAGAFGAHGLSNHFTRYPELEATFQTAVRYQLTHGLALFAVAWSATRWPGTLTNWSGYLFIAGVVIFSGTLYLLSITGIRWLGAITPIGGIAFLAGWLFLLLAAWRGS